VVADDAGWALMLKPDKLDALVFGTVLFIVANIWLAAWASR
jgi:hypothetical protein